MGRRGPRRGPHHSVPAAAREVGRGAGDPPPDALEGAESGGPRDQVPRRRGAVYGVPQPGRIPGDLALHRGVLGDLPRGQGELHDVRGDPVGDRGARGLCRAVQHPGLGGEVQLRPAWPVPAVGIQGVCDARQQGPEPRVRAGEAAPPDRPGSDRAGDARSREPDRQARRGAVEGNLALAEADCQGAGRRQRGQGARIPGLGRRRGQRRGQRQRQRQRQWRR
mmetsp:Transcript_21156/g.51777  ORF Transcript_21156/g.51777 Transcript_21156/m.51777 type:complete len:222 (-) Transcript_21156:1172-1837(-)